MWRSKSGRQAIERKLFDQQSIESLIAREYGSGRNLLAEMRNSSPV